MTTKAELEAELAALKKELRERDARAERDTSSSGHENATSSGKGKAFSDWMADHGVAPEDAEAALRHLGDELAELHEKSPILTTVAIFGAGVLLGRMLR